MEPMAEQGGGGAAVDVHAVAQNAKTADVHRAERPPMRHACALGSGAARR
eukprot:CAMPEP_0174703764 /NCGR_PEP_ID=MMETSP1094-20130205/7590_1 /TAXON_ID=156173 /ORGANISM="Chrysochromulina brevifilum, Strain UTEX LB 985" /LENGTH=49 /DNA_ID= /DNA_START= /DNA_END= /DNA_ORIENTATION=